MNEGVKIAAYAIADILTGAAAGNYVGRKLGIVVGDVFEVMRLVMPGYIDNTSSRGVHFSILAMGMVAGNIAGSVYGASGIYHVLNSNVFQPLIETVSVMCDGFYISSAARSVYNQTATLAKTSVSAISEKQLLVGGAVASAAIATGIYMLYKDKYQDQSQDQDQEFLDRVRLAEESLNLKFKSLEEVISKSNKNNFSKIKALHEQIITQYNNEDDKVVESVNKLIVEYKRVVNNIPEKNINIFIKSTKDVINAMIEYESISSGINISSHAAKVKKSRENSVRSLGR